MGSYLGGTSFYCRLDGPGHLVGLNPVAFDRSGINAFWGIFEGKLSLFLTKAEPGGNSAVNLR
jgi:hypothetical protein